MKKMFLSTLAVSLVLLVACAYFQAPEVPTGITAVYDAVNDVVTVSWDDVSGAKDYAIYRGSSADDLEEIETTSDDSWEDFNYTYLERYYAIEAKNDAGDSGPSEAIEAELSMYDRYEDDNTMADASTIELVGDAPSQRHSILPEGDVDYIKFHAQPPYGYNIEVPELSGIPLKLTLLDASGNQLDYDEDGINNFIVRIGSFSPDTAGDYYIRVEGKTSSQVGYYRIFFHEWE